METVREIEERALERLDEEASTYYQWAMPTTMRENSDAFERYLMKPRVMLDMAVRDLSTSILGHHVTFPICIAPTAVHHLAHTEAEVGTATGAKAAGVAYTMSMWAWHTPEEVTGMVPDGLKFFQLQFVKGQDVMLHLIQRAECLGFQALVLTLDHPVFLHRTKNVSDNLDQDSVFNFKSIFKDMDACMEVNGESIPYFNLHAQFLLDSQATWETVKWITSQTKLPVVAKGILSEVDADLAIDAGVSAILVSNHGARQLDGLIATLDALPGIVRAARGRCEVYMDGGVRHGSHVFKALALGARAVFIGRPAIYGLACEGAKGVEKVLNILYKELDTIMAFTGCRCIADIDASRVVHRSQLPSHA